MQRGSTLKRRVTPKEDVWLSSECLSCGGGCGILVHRVDGVVVDVKGDPDHPRNWGKMCAKGYATIMDLYDPNRLLTPLKRTNPEKGLGIDPGWVPISWDEALDIMEKELTRVRKEDPRKLWMASFETPQRHEMFSKAFGSPNYYWQGYFCGNSVHAASFLTNGTFRPEYDIDNCNYLIQLGTHYGFGVGHDNIIAAKKMAAARKRGIKVVIVDPYCNPAAAKADEWLPIRPGTDGALVLSMINVLLNELGIYDREFIKRYTNGPYLVKPDGYYARREGKPLVWDSQEGTAKTFDAEVKDYAIEAPEGSYLVDGVECFPAFHLLKEHVKKYTPEMAAEITTIPAATIRRIAEEFGREARIGSTIVIDGKEFPYRPANLNFFRGAYAHKHGTATALVCELLNQLVGNFYVPGGHRGMTAVGPSWSWQPEQHADGLVLPKGYRFSPDYYDFKVKEPETGDLRELFPISTNWAPVHLLTVANPEKYKLPYEPEVLITCRRNLFLSGVNHKMTEEVLKKFRSIFFFGTHLDEMSELADLALPDVHNLEKPIMMKNSGTGASAIDYWYYTVKEPVVTPPLGEARDWWDVLLELAERMGFLGDVYEFYNQELKEPYKLDPSKKYSNEEICDRKLKSSLGEDKGLEWFRENGSLSGKMTADELNPLPWLKVRFPIYYENFLRAGAEVQKVTESMGLKDWDVSDYEALPDWKPCPAYEEKEGERDLLAFNFRVATHSFSWTAENPWLAELAEFNPYAQKVIINTETAKRKGIKDGDRVYVESAVAKVSGIAKVTECVHPEAVGISGHFGSLAKGKPIAYGKGTNFNNLLPFGEKWMDPVSTGVDACVNVKVYKA